MGGEVRILGKTAREPDQENLAILTPTLLERI